MALLRQTHGLENHVEPVMEVIQIPNLLLIEMTNVCSRILPQLGKRIQILVIPIIYQVTKYIYKSYYLFFNSIFLLRIFLYIFTSEMYMVWHSHLCKLEREPVVDYPTFLWSDYPTDYPISDTRPPVVPSVGQSKL